MTNCKTKCSDGKCGDDKAADSKELECAVTAEKNLLHLSFLYNNSGFQSRRDLSATYEIVIYNRSCHEIRDVSIRDTMLGLISTDFTGDNDGETRPFYTSIIAYSPTLVPNSFNQIATAGGELLGAGSTVPARSLVTLQIRITGAGYLITTPPTGGAPNDPSVNSPDGNDVGMAIQNTAMIRGNVCKGKACGCKCYIPLFPIYVKSGIKRGINVSRNFFVNPPVANPVPPP